LAAAAFAVHKHLPRLERVWIEPAIYFVTICTKDRQRILAREPIAHVLISELQSVRQRHRWVVGRYVIMPDHVHFFCALEPEAKMLSHFVGAWKTWTSRRIHEFLGPQPAAAATTALWQRGFFDHVLRSEESYDEKWNYVRDNPVRAGLVRVPEDWPYSGEVERLAL
jgi:REP-associated tyrosine transposase